MAMANHDPLKMKTFISASSVAVACHVICHSIILWHHIALTHRIPYAFAVFHRVSRPLSIGQQTLKMLLDPKNVYNITHTHRHTERKRKSERERLTAIAKSCVAPSFVLCHFLLLHTWTPLCSLFRSVSVFCSSFIITELSELIAQIKAKAECNILLTNNPRFSVVILLRWCGESTRNWGGQTHTHAHRVFCRTYYCYLPEWATSADSAIFNVAHSTTNNSIMFVLSG